MMSLIPKTCAVNINFKLGSVTVPGSDSLNYLACSFGVTSLKKNFFDKRSFSKKSKVLC